MGQLFFNFHNNTKYIAEDLICEDFNQELIHFFFSNNKLYNIIFIYGENGVGKSFISNLFLKKQSGAEIPLLAFEKNVVNKYLENHSVLLIDNIESFLPKHEELLFHLYNDIISSDKILIITAKENVEALNINLLDLKSRLKSALILHLKQPTQKILEKLFIKMLSDKQLHIDADVVAYLFKRIERSTPSIKNTVETLEKIVMEQQKTITIPTIKTYFNL